LTGRKSTREREGARERERARERGWEMKERRMERRIAKI
jgi:hypothetical protein